MSPAPGVDCTLTLASAALGSRRSFGPATRDTSSTDFATTARL